MAHDVIMPELTLNRTTTALVVIDLQKGIATQPTQPYPAQDVIRNAARLVAAFRKHGMPVFLVHVVTTPETALKVESDLSFSRPSPLPADWSEFVPEIAPVASDVVIGKKQWGAFYGTDLDLQLRRRKMDTIVTRRDIHRLRRREHGPVRVPSTASSRSLPRTQCHRGRHPGTMPRSA